MSSLQALSLQGASKALAAPGAGLAGGPPLPSKRAKLLEARIEADAVKRKAASNCAAAARLACDRDMINGIRLIALCSLADHMTFLPHPHEYQGSRIYKGVLLRDVSMEAHADA